MKSSTLLIISIYDGLVITIQLTMAKYTLADARTRNTQATYYQSFQATCRYMQGYSGDYVYVDYIKIKIKQPFLKAQALRKHLLTLTHYYRCGKYFRYQKEMARFQNIFYTLFFLLSNFSTFTIKQYTLKCLKYLIYNIGI